MEVLFMITYTLPMNTGNIEAVNLGLKIQEISIEEKSIDELSHSLFEVLKTFFPLRYILISYTLNQPDEEWYYMYPSIPGDDGNLPLKTTREQLQLIESGPKSIVRFVTEKDHSIIAGLLRTLFPETPFSCLFLRTLREDNSIITFSLVIPGKKTCYTQNHMELLAAVFENIERLLLAYRPVRGHRISHTRNTPGEELRFLPLEKMPGMRQVVSQIWKVARHDCPVLLLGETGVGKEAAADLLYYASARAGSPFVKVNCGCLPETLIDSELFGHEKGAFTGAVQTVKGRFERAHHGVLLLDEVGELPLLAQTKLLRVLQEGVVERVGGVESHHVDVRIIAATHRNLKRMVKEGKFREDLFYRLNIFPIWIPPLRERREDIPLLVRFLLKNKCRQFAGGKLPSISDENMKKLMAYSWPGNVRELNNVIERAVILWGNDIKNPVTVQCCDVFSRHGDIHPADEDMCSMDEAVRRHIRKALALSKGKISGPGGAAELLRMQPTTLRSRMLKLGIAPENSEN